MSSGPVLILGASSGFGAAVARAFAEAGHDIIGVHLDRRSTLDRVEALRADIEATGQRALLFNLNAADDQKRTEILDQVSEFVGSEPVGVLVHSLAFGTLKPFVPQGEGVKGVSRKQLEMTIDVMANSLVYWVQDMVERLSLIHI